MLQVGFALGVLLVQSATQADGLLGPPAPTGALFKAYHAAGLCGT